MKKVILLQLIVILHSLVSTISAQAPQSIPYQAIARNNVGNPITNQAISIRFSIHDATAGGSIIYRETQTSTTNALGLFTVNIGAGTVVNGVFSKINWGTSSKFLQVEMDPAGGSAYTDMGTQQMMSVPYALYADKVPAIVESVSAAGTNSSPTNIPDNDCIGITSTINVAGQTNPVNPTMISVTLNLTHTYDGDLYIYLIAPNGNILCLSSANGGAGDNFTNTVFSDNSSTNISAGSAPFTGTFNPNGSLINICTATPTVSTFAAMGGGSINPNGTWTLKIMDNAFVDVGTLNSWSISIASSVAGTYTNYVPKWNASNTLAPTSIYDNSGNVGIGTTTASEKLEVSGNLRVTGKGNIGPGNTNTGSNAFVAGNTNSNAQENSTITGGLSNSISSIGRRSGILSGFLNTLNGDQNVIAGGQSNSINLGRDCFIGSGQDNHIDLSDWSVIGGGANNSITIQTEWSTIGGGDGNTVNNFGKYGTIPGGRLNTVGAEYGFAAGRRAKALHTGAFVWGDNTDADFSSTAANQFLIRAANVGIGTNLPTAKLSVNGNANNTTGVWGVFSDSRIKNINGNFTDGLNVITRLNTVKFTYNEKAPFQTADLQIGIIAQELELIAPYMVSKKSGNGFSDLREVNPQAYTFLLINSVKELQAEIENLKVENEKLKSENVSNAKASKEQADDIKKIKAQLGMEEKVSR